MDESKFAYGVSSELYKSFKFKGIGNILTKIRYLYGSSTDAMFTPLFGNLYIGDRQHYSARQGSIIGGELKYTPSFFKKGTLKLGYFRNLRDFKSNNTVLSVLDKTLTPMGSRMIKQWIMQPLMVKDKIGNFFGSRFLIVSEAFSFRVKCKDPWF